MRDKVGKRAECVPPAISVSEILLQGEFNHNAGCVAGEEKKKESDVVTRNATNVLAPKARFEHADDRLLIGNDLRLPDQDDGHYTHGEDAEAEGDASLCLRSRNVEYAANPFHEGLLWSEAEKQRYRD